MAEKIVMLALSPTMQSGHIAKWRKKEGDPIRSGEVLCEVETDKATMEYESSVDGILLKIVVPAGKAAVIGEMIAVAGKANENITELLGQKGADAGTVPKTASTDNVVETIAINTSAVFNQPDGRIKASPLARRLAKENGLDLSKIVGSGPEGRIIKRDLEKVGIQTTELEENVELEMEKKFAGIVKNTSVSPKPIFIKEAKTQSLFPAGEVIPVSTKRKIIAQRLSQSQFTAPHYFLKASVNMDTILAARQRLNSNRSDKISLNAFLVKICSQALSKHPLVNASWQEDKIVQFSTMDIGLAVAQPDGLITPIVRNCQAKGIVEIDQELRGLIERALTNKLTLEEFQNATFTISNLGSFGIEEFTAIINPPGSAILAIGEIRREAVVQEEKIVIQSRMKMTLSCDHRIIDGALGASFLKTLKNMLEEPIQALY